MTVRLTPGGRKWHLIHPNCETEIWKKIKKLKC
jgi:hypothetical protein